MTDFVRHSNGVGMYLQPMFLQYFVVKATVNLESDGLNKKALGLSWLDITLRRSTNISLASWTSRYTRVSAKRHWNTFNQGRPEIVLAHYHAPQEHDNHRLLSTTATSAVTGQHCCCYLPETMGRTRASVQCRHYLLCLPVCHSTPLTFKTTPPRQITYQTNNNLRQGHSCQLRVDCAHDTICRMKRGPRPVERSITAVGNLLSVLINTSSSSLTTFMQIKSTWTPKRQEFFN